MLKKKRKEYSQVDVQKKSEAIYLDGFRTLNMVFNRDGSTSSEPILLEVEFTSGDSSSCAVTIMASLPVFFPIFFLMLPLIERIEPRETREGDVSFFFMSIEASSPCSTDSAGGWFSALLVSLFLKTLLISVPDFLMKEPPLRLFFLVVERSEVLLLLPTPGRL